MVNQWEAALVRANDVRTRRAIIRAEIRSRKTTVGSVLLDMPKAVETMTVERLLAARRGYGPDRVRRLLLHGRGIGDIAHRRLGDLTERQYEELLRVVHRSEY